MTYETESKRPLGYVSSRVSRKLFHLRKRVRHRLMNGARSTRVAFLVGSGRSGTDVVVSKVAGSLDAALVNEDHPGAFENWRLRDLEIVDRFVEEAYAPVLLFKPIVETYRVGELLDHYAASRAIFLCRDPYDSMNSMIRFFGERTRGVVDEWIRSDFSELKTWSVPAEVRDAARELYAGGVELPDAAGIYWFVYNSAFEALGLDRDSRVILMLYEDFVRDPALEIQRACRHLEIPFRGAMAEGIYASAVRRHPPPPLRPAINESCRRVWDGIRSRRSTGP